MSRNNSASVDDWDEIPSWFYNVRPTNERQTTADPPSPPQSPNSTMLDSILSPAGLPPISPSPGLNTKLNAKTKSKTKILEVYTKKPKL